MTSDEEKERILNWLQDLVFRTGSTDVRKSAWIALANNGFQDFVSRFKALEAGRLTTARSCSADTATRGGGK